MQSKVLSLFSGAGGLDLGLERAGFSIVQAVDINPWACATLKLNRPDISVLNADISTLDVSGLKRADVVAGGPPCQSFSTAGKRGGIDDKRGELVFHYTRLIEELEPKFFIFENVIGLLSIKAGSQLVLDMLTKKFNDLGYRLDTFFVDASDYGTPQYRRRIIIIGNNCGLQAKFPPKQPRITLRTALSTPDPDPMYVNFSPARAKYMAMVPEGKNWRALPNSVRAMAMGNALKSGGGKTGYYRRLAWDEPSLTVLTTPTQKATMRCHPVENRPLTVGESALLQGFPPTWKFCGSLSQRYRLVGNAVPPPLGEAAGTAIVNAEVATDDGNSVVDLTV